MFADYTYYTGTFKGTKIKSSDEYIYLGQQASRYILKVTNKINEDTKQCECALCEYLLVNKKSQSISSETIPSAYSVTYANKQSIEMEQDINNILELYLGYSSSVGIVDLIG